MAAIGIVCEYNPFHYGHAYHIQKSREQVGAETAVICVLSGDFVQRGEAAVYSKFARAEAACRCGADLVFELPLPWALSSAEGFARGAVALLAALGVTKLCFGSETGRLNELDAVARTLLLPGLQGDIRALLAQDGSLSYPAARQQAVKARLGDAAEILSQPNNILAVEYLKAVYDLQLNLEPVAICRIGSGHDAACETGPRSASEIRRRLRMGRGIENDVPAEALAVYAHERHMGREIRDRAVFETALLSRLRMFDETHFNSLPDAADGLGNRLFRAVRQEASYDAVLAATGTKRYPMARIRRLCLCACLNIKAGMSDMAPPYARLLAANSRGREYLREWGPQSVCPVITKPASVKGLPSDAQKLFSLGAGAHDFYVLGFPSVEERKPGGDWRTSPKMI